MALALSYFRPAKAGKDDRRIEQLHGVVYSVARSVSANMWSEELEMQLIGFKDFGKPRGE